MGFAPKSYFLIYIVAVLPAVLGYSEDNYTTSRATYCRTPDCLDTPKGACGYGEYVRNGVAVSDKIYRRGMGCGACIEVRCTNTRLCSENGVKVVVTDYAEGNSNTGIIFSKPDFWAMARPGAASQLFSWGVITIEYRRVPCVYPNHNLAVKVNERSRYGTADYLAIVFLYQAGMYDITAVQLWQAENKGWKDMRRVYGAVWSMAHPPRGALSLRVQLASGSAGSKWVNLGKAIPKKWKPGAVYETGIKLG